MKNVSERHESFIHYSDDDNDKRLCVDKLGKTLQKIL